MVASPKMNRPPASGMLTSKPIIGGLSSGHPPAARGPAKSVDAAVTCRFIVRAHGVAWAGDGHQDDGHHVDGPPARQWRQGRSPRAPARRGRARDGHQDDGHHVDGPPATTSRTTPGAPSSTSTWGPPARQWRQARPRDGAPARRGPGSTGTRTTGTARRLPSALGTRGLAHQCPPGMATGPGTAAPRTSRATTNRASPLTGRPGLPGHGTTRTTRATTQPDQSAHRATRTTRAGRPGRPGPPGRPAHTGDRGSRDGHLDPASRLTPTAEATETTETTRAAVPTGPRATGATSSHRRPGRPAHGPDQSKPGDQDYPLNRTSRLTGRPGAPGRPERPGARDTLLGPSQPAHRAPEVPPSQPPSQPGSQGDQLTGQARVVPRPPWRACGAQPLARGVAGKPRQSSILTSRDQGFGPV